MVAPVFTDEELESLRWFPEIGREELFRFFTLTPADSAFIDPGRGRGPADRLGLAVAVCTLPWLGFVPDDVASAPPAAVARLAEQLQVDPEEIRSHGRRAKTRTDHLRLAAQYLGWRPPTTLELKELDGFLLARAMEHDSPTLFRPVIQNTGLNSPLSSPGEAGSLQQVASPAATSERRTARFFEVSRWGHLAWLADQATGPEENLWTKRSRPWVIIVVSQFSQHEQETLMSESYSLPTEPEDMAAALRERFNSGKVSEMIPLYEPEAVLIKNDGRTVTGHSGIAAELERDLSLGLPLKVNARHVFVAGDIAEIVLDWSIEGTGPDGKHVHLGGSASDVLRRGADGIWRYLIDNNQGTAVRQPA